MPGRGQFHALGLAIEQGDAQLALQVADPLAHRRQRQVLALGGPGQAVLIGDGDEQFEGDEINATHVAEPLAFVPHEVLQCKPLFSRLT
ncbi:hypothetical protein FQZ97_933730 [compost metagenome]